MANETTAVALDGVVVVDRDDHFLGEIAGLFDGRVAMVRSLDEVDRLVRAGEADLVFLGPSFATSPGVAEATRLFEHAPDLALILIVREDVSNDVLRTAIRSGLRDVLEAPLTREAVEEVLRQFERPARRRAEPGGGGLPDREGKVITVMAAKGGSGKTVVATNVATLLARWGEADQVAIVDADLQFGDVALVLQVEPKHTIVNAAKESTRLDEAFLERLLARHASGLRVLAAPLEPAFADEVATETLTRILSLMRTMFRFTVVDTAPAFDERLLAILERSDVVLFVVDMDLPSVKNAKLALETLRILNYPSNKIKIVLNRSNSKARLDFDEIERSLRVKIAASIPSDGLLPASVNEGVPIVESHPKSKPAKGFEDVAGLLVEAVPTESGRRRRWF